MSNPKFACIIPGCTKSVAGHHIVKHILAHSQSEVRAKLEASLGCGARGGSLVRLRVKVEGVDNNFQACLGCNKIFRKIPLQVAHQESCHNKQKHKEVCKSFLTSEPVVEPVAPSGDEAKLKSQIEKLKKDLEFSKSKEDEYLDFKDTIKKVISIIVKSYKQGIPYNVFDETLQDNKSALYDSIIGYLQDDN